MRLGSYTFNRLVNGIPPDSLTQYNSRGLVVPRNCAHDGLEENMRIHRARYTIRNVQYGVLGYHLPSGFLATYDIVNARPLPAGEIDLVRRCTV